MQLPFNKKEVMPAQAGIQGAGYESLFLVILDPRLRGGDAVFGNGDCA